MLRLSESVRVVALDQRAVAIGKLIALLLLLLVVWLAVSCCSWLIHDVCATSTIVLRWLHPRWIIWRGVLESTRFALLNVLALGTEFTRPLVTTNPTVAPYSGTSMTTWIHASRRVRIQWLMMAIGRLMDITHHVIWSASREPCSRVAPAPCLLHVCARRMEKGAVCSIAPSWLARKLACGLWTATTSATSTGWTTVEPAACRCCAVSMVLGLGHSWLEHAKSATCSCWLHLVYL